MLTDDDKSANRDLATSLGHLIIEFGRLEESFRQFIWVGTGVGTGNGALLTADMTFRQTVHTAARTYRWRGAGWTTSFADAFNVSDFVSFPLMFYELADPWIPRSMKNLCDRAIRASEERNKAIHGAWWMPPMGDFDATRLRVQPNSRELVMEPVSLGALDSVTAEAMMLRALVHAVTLAVASDERYKIPGST